MLARGREWGWRAAYDLGTYLSALLCPAVYKSVLPARNAILCLYSNVFVPQRLGCKGILYKSYLQAQDPTGSYVAESINDFSTEFDFLVF